jgi:Sm_like domain
MAANVKILKLITGEELLGEILPGGPSVCEIKNPVRIVVMPNKMDPKTPNVGFAPWAEFSDQKTFIIDKSHVLCIIEPIKEFVNQYNSMFGGLVLPTSNLIKPGA